MIVYGVVSAQTEQAVELFVRREDAETFLDDVRGDDEELAATASARGGRARRLSGARARHA